MESLLLWFSHHPLVAILIAATAVVVAAYFIRKNFTRILMVGVLTLAGYFMYMNGFFSKENLDKVKKISFSDIESGTEKNLKEGYDTVKSLTPVLVEKKADALRTETRKEMMPLLTENAPAATADKKAAAGAAAPAGAIKRNAPAAGVKTAVSAKSKTVQKKEPAKKTAPAKQKEKKTKGKENAE